MFRLRSQYRNRIKYLYLADKLLSNKIIVFDFRNAIDIRFLIFGKFVIPQMKNKKDEFINYVIKGNLVDVKSPVNLKNKF